MEPVPGPTTETPQAPRGATTRYPAVPGSPWARLRHSAARAWDEARAPKPPPPREDRVARFWYGLQQPLLGLRLLLRDGDLLASALVPVLVVAGVCSVAAFTAASSVRGDPWWSFGNPALGFVISFVAAFTTTFLALAPVPPFLFARHYARIAARARDRLGTGPCTPYLKPLRQSLGETLAQMVVIAIGLGPITLAAAFIPDVGSAVALLAQLAWTMYWMVVEAYDNGRTLAEGETVEHVQAVEERLARTEPAWFVRMWPAAGSRGPLAAISGPLRAWCEVLDTITRGWRPEMRLTEREPALSAGFGLGVAILLTLPVVNLLFRPALVIAAANLRGQLEREVVPPVA